MKYLAIILGFTFLMHACNKPQEPEFKKIQNIKIKEGSVGGKLHLTADALFHNPNGVGINVTKTDLNVVINDVELGKVDQVENVKIEKQSDFSLPLQYQFDTKQLKASNWGSVAQILLKKQADVTLKGTVTVKVLGVGIKVPVEHTEKVPIKL